MKMVDNIDFAIRSIDIYERTKTQIEHEFTHVCGALLNILSVIREDDSYMIDLPVTDNLLGNNTSEEDVVSFLDNLRNGLAHKTDANYKGNAEDLTERLYSVTVDSRWGNPVELSFSDLEQILEYLKTRIKSQYPERFIE
jgi:hypothetical protein